MHFKAQAPNPKQKRNRNPLYENSLHMLAPCKDLERSAVDPGM